MSARPVPHADHPVSRKTTVHTLLQKKRARQPITALTACDYPTAQYADQAGIDLVLVGDSLAMTVLGHPDTLSITLDEMLHHARAVRRGIRRALLVVDMPYGSYHLGPRQAVRNALRLVKQAGAEAIKLEGARPELVERIVQAEIPVIGHLGLTPQSLHRMGGYRVQGREQAAADAIQQQAIALQAAGASAIVLEGLPRELAAAITRSSCIPTIGIGAGPDCDGQILVFHDLLGLTPGPLPRFVRAFADAGALIRNGLQSYRDAVLQRDFPADSESYHQPPPADVHQQEALAGGRR